MKTFIWLVLISLCCVYYTAYAQTRFQNQSATDLQVIDAHTHTDFSGGPERTSGIAKTAAQYFKANPTHGSGWIRSVATYSNRVCQESHQRQLMDFSNAASFQA